MDTTYMLSRRRLRRRVGESVRRMLREAAERGNYIVAELRRRHAEYNEKYFYGELNDADIVLVNQPASRVIGCYVPKLVKHEGIITTSYLVRSETIKFNTAYVDDEDEINNTLLHEMCHQWVYDTQVHGAEFDTLDRDAMAEFEKGFRSDGGHGQEWLDVAARVSRESGYDITRTSDTARKSDEAETAMRARAVKEKEIMVGAVKFGDDCEWAAFMTTRACVPRLTDAYTDDVRWKWYAMHTNGLNNARGWCCKSSVSRTFGCGDTPDAAVADLKETLGKYIGDAEIRPADIGERTDFRTYVGVLRDDLSSESWGWIFKPSQAMVRQAGCGVVCNAGVGYKMCLARVDSKELWGHPGGDPEKTSRCMLAVPKDKDSARAWFDRVLGGVPKDLEPMFR